MKTIISMMIIVCLLLSVSGLTSVTAEAQGQYAAKVVSSTLNVRSEPSLQASIEGALKQGDVVTVTDEESGWLKVSNKSISGWVAGYYTKKTNGGSRTVSPDNKPTTSSSVKNNGTGTKQGAVLADSLRIRSGAGSSFKVVGGLFKGEIVKILSSRDGWLEIQTPDGKLGWVSAQYISKGTTGTTQKSQTRGLKGKVIVIDPGHGGSDPGMIGVDDKTMEKELTLSTSLYIQDELRQRGATVILTRTKDDQKPSLAERVRISENAHADAFVSVHYNSSEKNNSGTLTFYYSDTKDKPLAHAIENELSKGVSLTSNGVSFGDFHVLRENDAVSALVELGFLSNEDDEAIVRKPAYQKKAAVAIANGLADYFQS